MFNNEVFLKKPIKPAMANYWTPPESEAEAQSQRCSRALPSAPPNVNISNLTVGNQESFKFDYIMYQEDLKMYNQEVKFIRKLQNWIEKTVSQAYQKTSCPPTNTV